MQWMGLDVSNQRDCPVNNVGFNIEKGFCYFYYFVFTIPSLGKISGETLMKLEVM